MTILVARPSGKGALLSGGLPGNRGGTGRPSSEVRARCRGAFFDRIPVLESIADDGEAHPADRIRALELLAKYGLGTDFRRGDETERMKTGIIALPERDLQNVQAMMAGDPRPDGLDYVVVDEDLSLPDAPAEGRESLTPARVAQLRDQARLRLRAGSPV